ncbi:MAG TPA: VOC family protein [Acholeplasmataceae bacterium]|nr:VOC family protein [Acholeplasmataceae bacterium]
MSKYHKKPTIYVANISLRVVNLDRSIRFYNEVLGFQVLEKTDNSVVMGFKDNPFVKLVKAETAKELRTAGLYHIAFLVPKREDLANWLYYHLNMSNTNFTGASHHAVSEAIYLNDVDGNGIEVYTDTDPGTWDWDNGSVDMVTERLDLEDLFKEVTDPTHSLPSDTLIGHIHLSVLDIEESRSFYHLLGFETVLLMSSAAFLSHNKYHHHIGMNIWHTRNGRLHNDYHADMDNFTVKYHDKTTLEKVLNNLSEAGFGYEKSGEKVVVRDVNNIKVILEV